MLFHPLYYPDRLRLINPSGDVGITTLWSQVDPFVKILEQLQIDLDPATSRIAVIANLYGNGLPHMLRNFLWNPQLRYLVIVGQDLSGSREQLRCFFENGLEEVDYLGSPAWQIVGTKRVIDGEVTPESFVVKPKLTVLGKISEGETQAGLREFFDSLPAQEAGEWERRDVPIPEATVTRFPSQARDHNIVRAAPLEVWEELIFRLVRFGHRSKLKKGERIELLNVKCVIETPVEESAEDLDAYGFSLAHFREYQARILEANKPADLSYTYGNRMRGYFRHEGETVDSLDIAIKRLRDDPESRHAYIALWDNGRDLPLGHGCPCLVSVFFRRFEARLDLTATFRAHNAMDAWLENVYGLMAIHWYVAERAGIEPGPITVFSHSISLDVAVLERAKKVAESKTSDDVLDRVTGKHELRFDPNGNFTVTIDREAGELVVQHSYNGVAINEYRGKSAEAIERQLARDDAVTVISHALYLGRELARKEAQLKAELKAQGPRVRATPSVETKAENGSAPKPEEL